MSTDGSQEGGGGQEGPEMSKGQGVSRGSPQCSQAGTQSGKAATRKLTSGPWHRRSGEVRAAPECPNDCLACEEKGYVVRYMGLDLRQASQETQVWE